MKQPYRYKRAGVRLELILMMFLLPIACSLPYDLLPSDGPAVRYDNLPDKDDEDAVLADYQALSQWDKLDLTYVFITGTERLEGEREEELVREAFAFWAAQSPLTDCVSRSHSGGFGLLSSQSGMDRLTGNVRVRVPPGSAASVSNS